jgi:hypothetical protein
LLLFSFLSPPFASPVVPQSKTIDIMFGSGQPRRNESFSKHRASGKSFSKKRPSLRAGSSRRHEQAATDRLTEQQAAAAATPSTNPDVSP